LPFVKISGHGILFFNKGTRKSPHFYHKVFSDIAGTKEMPAPDHHTAEPFMEFEGLHSCRRRILNKDDEEMFNSILRSIYDLINVTGSAVKHWIGRFSGSYQ